MCLSKILVVLGLIFEFSSVAVTQAKVFDVISKFIRERILQHFSKYRMTDNPWVARTTFGLLILGIVLQIIAVFV